MTSDLGLYDSAISGNAYKVPLMRNLVKRAIRGVEGSWTS